MVYVPGFVSNIEVMWEEPSMARFLRRLASFSRLILFDKRGTGLSDRLAPRAMPTLEERMDDDVAQQIYESDRCIECGCCIAACGVANIEEKFVGAAGLNRISRFAMDPRDAREDGDWFDVVATDQGIFGCIGLMACDDLCPKELPLQENDWVIIPYKVEHLLH